MSKAGLAGAPVEYGVPLLAEAVRLTGPKLKEMNEQAHARGDRLRETLTKMRMDLEKGISDKVIRTPK